MAEPIANREVSLDNLLDNADLSKLPPGLKDKLDIPKIESMIRGEKSLSVLLTGKTGSGKSTLANGIIGTKVAEEGASIVASCTREVSGHRIQKGRIQITVWDSPGLQDGTENQDVYLQSIKDKCSSVDLTLYCIEISKTRFVRGSENPDVLAMRKLTDALGTNFWKNTVIVLTFANTVEIFHLGEWQGLSPKKKGEAFESVIRDWQDQIQSILVNDISIPKEIADQVKVIPAGYYLVRQLPDRDYWLSDLWFECMDTLPTPEAQGALLELNISRMRTESDVNEDDFRRQPEEQPIIVPNENTNTKQGKEMLRHVATVLGCAGAGAVGGSAVGTAALVRGPIGAAIGVPAGFLLGFCVGLAFGFHKISEPN